MAIYSDEVSPGNQLKHTNQRKVQVLYWSLQELGEARRKDEQLAVSFAKMWLQRRHTPESMAGLVYHDGGHT